MEGAPQPSQEALYEIVKKLKKNTTKAQQKIWNIIRDEHKINYN